MMPEFVAESALASSRSAYGGTSRSASGGEAAVYPQGCSVWTWISCGVQIAACAAGCALGSGDWFPCMKSCLESQGLDKCIACI